MLCAIPSACNMLQALNAAIILGLLLVDLFILANMPRRYTKCHRIPTLIHRRCRNDHIGLKSLKPTVDRSSRNVLCHEAKYWCAIPDCRWFLPLRKGTIDLGIITHRISDIEGQSHHNELAIPASSTATCLHLPNCGHHTMTMMGCCKRLNQCVPLRTHAATSRMWILWTP